jgi:hypothetical protein
MPGCVISVRPLALVSPKESLNKYLPELKSRTKALAFRGRAPAPHLFRGSLRSKPKLELTSGNATARRLRSLLAFRGL